MLSLKERNNILSFACKDLGLFFESRSNQSVMSVTDAATRRQLTRVQPRFIEDNEIPTADFPLENL